MKHKYYNSATDKRFDGKVNDIVTSLKEGRVQVISSEDREYGPFSLVDNKVVSIEFEEVTLLIRKP